MGCQSLPVPEPAPTPTQTSVAERTGPTLPEDASANEIARTLIATERNAAIAGDLATLAAIWAPDATIVDGRTSAYTGDDYVWRGLPAILDRYELAVQPSPPPQFSEEELQSIHIESATDTRIQASLGVDRWTIVFDNNRWQLHQLRYN